MSPRYYKSKSGIGDFLDKYSADGVAVLTSEPSRTMRAVLLVLAAILLSAFVWSFIGKADVLVKASGTVVPESKQYKVQTPLKGEIIDIYVAEGMPVSAGDIVARVSSTRAIQMIGSTATAGISYENAKRAYERFPIQRQIMETQIKTLKRKLEADQLAQDKREAEALIQLGEEQAIKLQKARAKLAKAEEARNHAKSVLDSHERLFNSEGGGGISRQKVVEKRKEFREMQLDYDLALAELGEFEVTLSKEYNKKKIDIEKKAQELLSLQAQYDSAVLNLEKERQKLESDLRTQRAGYLASLQITSDDFDENNYLRLRAPMNGVVTKLLVEQTGIVIGDNEPILLLAPEDSRKVLEIAIPEKDRAFLRAGMHVKMKFNAFPYQRFGLMHGELEFVSPTTARDPKTKAEFYTARVGLDREYFTVNGDETPVRYGMGAQAEITIRKRRIIDIVLDPIRNIGG